MRNFSLLSLILVSCLQIPKVVCAQTGPQSPRVEDEDLLQQFQHMKQKLMDDFFSDSDSFMKDIDQNLFKSFGFGADLSGNLFQSRWQGEKDGQSFLITPKKDAELKIVVNNGFISIDASEKSHHGVSSSTISLNVPQDLDWKKHSITKKGQDIVVYFPYYPGMNSHKKKYPNSPKSPKDQDKRVQPSSSAEDDGMIPIVPNDQYDVI